MQNGVPTFSLKIAFNSVLLTERSYARASNELVT